MLMIFCQRREHCCVAQRLALRGGTPASGKSRLRGRDGRAEGFIVEFTMIYATTGNLEVYSMDHLAARVLQLHAVGRASACLRLA
jgi:hypothetical protein